MLLSLSASVSLGQTTPVSLENSETIFSVLSALNACGFDSELNASVPLRAQIRDEIKQNLAASTEASDVTHSLCEFYDQHRQGDESRTIAQYVSLGLYVDGPPNFSPKVREAELPPDAAFVAGVLPHLRGFYDKAKLHSLWMAHQRQFDALAAGYHDSVAKIMFDTEIYLKLPSSGYLGHRFTIFIEPMGAPGQSNARNYGSDYYVVISPGRSGTLKMDQIRHTYLHYLVDPLALKYPTALKRLDPLLEQVKTAPMDESFKTDAALLVTECLIRAVEIRTAQGGKLPAADQERMINDSTAQGFVLTRYFQQALITFEKDPVGMRDGFSSMLGGIDVGKEARAASQIQFAQRAEPELLHLAGQSSGHLLITAERQLNSGDLETARKLAQQALDENREDPGRALFILAQTSIKNGKIDEARDYFARALTVAKEPKVVAWSHIYLGRIFDLEEDRDVALDHYRAALGASGDLPEAKTAAERGIQQPYEIPKRSQ